jgi:hypothetical protein
MITKSESVRETWKDEMHIRIGNRSYFFLRRTLRKMTAPKGTSRSVSALKVPDPVKELEP